MYAFITDVYAITVLYRFTKISSFSCVYMTSFFVKCGETISEEKLKSYEYKIFEVIAIRILDIDSKFSAYLSKQIYLQQRIKLISTLYYALFIS